MKIKRKELAIALGEPSLENELREAMKQRWLAQTSSLLTPTNEEIDKAFESGCGECRELGSSWVHLRLCLTCGNVGCCDSSPQTHGRRHWQTTGHAVMRSIEHGEDWIFNFELNGYMNLQ